LDKLKVKTCPPAGGVKSLKLKNYRVTELQSYRVAKFQGFRVSEFQGFRVSGFQGFRHARLTFTMLKLILNYVGQAGLQGLVSTAAGGAKR
jgi:hypothetical protein